MLHSLQSLFGLESKNATKNRSSATTAASPPETRARGGSMSAAAPPLSGGASYGGGAAANDDNSYIGGDVAVDTEFGGTRSRTGSGYGATVSTAVATASAAQVHRGGAAPDSPPTSAALVPVFLPDDDDVHFFSDDRALARRYAGMSPADAAARLTAAGVSVADALLLARIANVYRGNARALAALAVEFGVRATAAAADDAAAAARRGIVEVWRHPAPRAGPAFGSAAAAGATVSVTAPAPSPSPKAGLLVPSPPGGSSAFAAAGITAGTMVSRGFPLSSSPDALAALLQMARARVPSVFAPPTRGAAAARAADKAAGGSGVLSGYFYPGLTFLPAAPGAGAATSPEAAAAAAASRKDHRPTSASAAATTAAATGAAAAAAAGDEGSGGRTPNSSGGAGHVRKSSYTTAAAAAAAAETAAAVAAASAASAAATALAIRATGAAGTAPVDPRAPHVPDAPAPAHAAAAGSQAVSGATAGGLVFYTNPPFDEAAGAWGEGHGPAGRAAAAGVTAATAAAAATASTAAGGVMSPVALAAARALAPAQTAVELSTDAAAATVAAADAAAAAAASVVRPPSSFPYPPSVFPAFAEALHTAHLAPGRGGSAVRLRVDVVKALTRGARFVHVGHGGAAVRTFRVSPDLRYLYWPHKGGPAARPPAGELPKAPRQSNTLSAATGAAGADAAGGLDDDAWEEADLSDPRTHRIYNSFFRTPSDTGSIDRQFVGYRRIPLEAITAVLPGPQSARLVHAVETVAATGAAAAGVGAGAAAGGGAIAETAPPLTPFTLSIHYVFPEPQPLEEEGGAGARAGTAEGGDVGGESDSSDSGDDDDEEGGGDDYDDDGIDEDDDGEEDEDDGGIKGYGNDFGYGGSRMRRSAAKLTTRGTRKSKEKGKGKVKTTTAAAAAATAAAAAAAAAGDCAGAAGEDATVTLAATQAAAGTGAGVQAEADAAALDGVSSKGSRCRSSSAPESHGLLHVHDHSATSPPSPTSASASRNNAAAAAPAAHGHPLPSPQQQQQKRVRMVHKSIDLAALDGNEYVVWLAGLALVRSKLSTAPPDVVAALRSLPVWLTLERRYPSVFTLVDVETGGSVEKTAETIALLASATQNNGNGGSGSSNGATGTTGPLTASPAPLRPVSAPRVARSAASALVPLGVIEAIVAQGPKKSSPMKWSRAYHLGDDGAIYDSLFARVNNAPFSLFLVKDSRSRVFGGYCASPWPSKRDCGYFGSPDAFVFRIVPPEAAPLPSTNPHHNGGSGGSTPSPHGSYSNTAGGGAFASKLTALAEGQLEVYHWQGQVGHHVLTETKGFGWGGGGGVALYVSRGLAEGRTEWCGTYQNPPLDGQGGAFRIFDIEVWVAQPW